MIFLILVVAVAVLSASNVALYVKYRAAARASRHGVARKVQGTMQSGRRRLSEEEIKRILELYGQGYSYRSIARIVGVSHTTVRRVVAKYGVLMDVPEAPPALGEEQAAAEA